MLPKCSVRCWLLLLVSGQDSVNPSEQGRALYDAVAPENKKLYEEVTVHHYDIYEGEYFERIVEVQVEWFERYL